MSAVPAAADADRVIPAGSTGGATEALADLSAVIFRAFVALKLREAQHARETDGTTAAGKATVGQNGGAGDASAHTLLSTSV